MGAKTLIPGDGCECEVPKNAEAIRKALLERSIGCALRAKMIRMPLPGYCLLREFTL
jgi:hypothetical protein